MLEVFEVDEEKSLIRPAPLMRPKTLYNNKHNNVRLFVGNTEGFDQQFCIFDEEDETLHMYAGFETRRRHSSGPPSPSSVRAQVTTPTCDAVTMYLSEPLDVGIQCSVYIADIVLRGEAFKDVMN